MLTGQVEDLSEPPLSPVGEQSAFIGGLAAACAGMHAALSAQGGGDRRLDPGSARDPGDRGAGARGPRRKGFLRQRVGDGNGATVPSCRPATASSPSRRARSGSGRPGLPRWARPAGAAMPRFARKADRVANWDALHALMSDWSRQHRKQWIADAAQAAHVPSFPSARTRRTTRKPATRASRLLSVRRRSAVSRFRCPVHRSGSIDAVPSQRRPGAPRVRSRSRGVFGCWTLVG